MALKQGFYKIRLYIVSEWKEATFLKTQLAIMREERSMCTREIKGVLRVLLTMLPAKAFASTNSRVWQHWYLPLQINRRRASRRAWPSGWRIVPHNPRIASGWSWSNHNVPFLCRHGVAPPGKSWEPIDCFSRTRDLRVGFWCVSANEQSDWLSLRCASLHLTSYHALHRGCPLAGPRQNQPWLPTHPFGLGWWRWGCGRWCRR